MRPRRLSAATLTLAREHDMTNDEKQPNSGYHEDNLKPSKGKPKVPGEGHPKESQNDPKQKPGKQGS
jgi:hypothetical protein